MNKYKSYAQIDLPWIKRIPSHWKINKVKRYSISKKEINKGNKEKNVLSLTYKGVIKNNLDNPNGLVPKSYETYQKFEKNDLVFKLIDLENIKTSRVGIVHEDGIMSPAYIRLEMNEKFFSKYAYYYFYKLYLEEVYNNLGSGVRSTMTVSDLQDILIPIPSYIEQKQIANYLDWKIGEIDKLIEIEKKKLDELEELISNKIDRYILKINNNSSQHIKLRYLYSFQNGISTSKDYKTGKYPFLTYSDVYNNLVIPRKLSGKIDSTPEERKVYSIKKGDLFFTRTSERLEDAGKVSLADKSVSYSVFNGFTIRLRPNNRTVFFDKFILYYLNSNLVRESFIGTLNIVTRVSIKQELLKNIEIPFISKDEQRKLINHIELMFKNSTKIIELSKNKISYLSDLKQSLISEVVTGQIDVRNVKIPESK